MNLLLRCGLLLLLTSAGRVFADECVVLLHGLGRTSRSMAPIGRYLKKEGFTVYNISYPSTRYSIELLSSLVVAPRVADLATRHDSISFVTHSMGGIVVRYLLSRNTVPCKSVVMLCPPNGGSQLANALKKSIGWLYRLIDGPAGQQLGSGAQCILPKLEKLQVKTGIIAGDKSWEPYFSWVIPGADDGKVAVDETKLPEMTDFMVLNHTHTFMMNNRDTQENITSFLKTGTFIHH